MTKNTCLRTSLQMIIVCLVWQIGLGFSITTIFLGDLVQINSTTDLNNSSIDYYKLVIPSIDEKQIQSILLLDGFSKYDIMIAMYAQITDKNLENQSLMPNSQSYQFKCESVKIVSCLINMSQISGNSSIYISVVMQKPSILYFSPTISKFHPIPSSEIVYVELNQSQNTALYELSMQQFSQQIMIIGEYYSDDGVETFYMEIINSDFKIIKKSKTISGDSKAIKLDPANETTLLKVYGSPNCKLKLSAAEPVNDIQINQPFWYLYDKTTVNNFYEIFLDIYRENPSNITEQKMNILVYTYTGQSTIEIDYCLIDSDSDSDFVWQYKFYNSATNSVNILIPQKQRDYCQENNGQQAVSIKIVDPSDFFFFSIIPIADMGTEGNLYETETIISVALSECTQYDLLWMKPDVELTLSVTFLDENLKQYFETSLFQCQKKCEKEIKKQSERGQVSLYEWSPGDHWYKLEVCSYYPNQQIPTSQYSVLLKTAHPRLNILGLFKTKQQYIQMSKITYYQVSISQQQFDSHLSANHSQLAFSIQPINGIISVGIVSTQEQLQQCLDLNAPYFYEQNQLFDYQANQTRYICVKGLTEAIFNIQASIVDEYEDPGPHPDPQPDPEPQYIQFDLQDGKNAFDAPRQMSTIFKYSAHFIPYTISVNGQPDCLEIYYQQQQAYNISHTYCVNSQGFFNESFTENEVYLRLFFSQDSINISTAISIEVSLPQLVLSNSQFVSLSCKSFCSINITVNVEESMYLRHYGMGILLADNSTEVQYVDCPPEKDKCNVTVSAIMPFGGLMFIQDKQAQSKFVTWSHNQAPFVSSEIKLLIPLNRYSSINKLLLRYPGSCVDVSYTLHEINNNQHNSEHYNYEPPGQAIFNEECVSFQDVMRIDLSQISPQHCSEYSCYVTLIASQDDSAFSPILQTNESFILQFAVNSYKMKIPRDIPYQLTEVYGIRQFQSNENPQPNLDQISVIKQSICESISLSYDPQSQILQAVTLSACQYTVLFSSCHNPSLLEGIAHTVYGDVESEYLTYYNLKNDSFKVTAWHPHKKVAPETLNIAIKSIKSSNKQIQIQCTPFTFKENSSQFTSVRYDEDSLLYSGGVELSINGENQYPGMYIISIETDMTDKKQENLSGLIISVLSINKKSPLTIIANEKPVPIEINNSENKMINYKYYGSQQIFQICVSILPVDNWSGSSTLIIESNQTLYLNMTENQFTSSNISDNCVDVKVSNPLHQIYQYDISLNLKKEKNQKGNQTIVRAVIYEQVNPQRLYPGVAVLENDNTFKHCYSYVPFVDDQQIIVFVYNNADQSTKVPHISQSSLSDVHSLDININYPNNSDNNRYISFSINPKNVSLDYYYWCISDYSPKYYIIIDDNDQMEVMFSDQLKYHSSVSTQTFDIYEMIVPQPNLLTSSHSSIINLIIQVVECNSNAAKLTILGTTNYQDITTGAITEIQDEIQDINGMHIARGVGIAPAYYYIGIKKQKESQKYSIQSYIDYTGEIPHRKWQLLTPNITNIKYEDLEENQEPYIKVILPKLVSTQKSINQSQIANYNVEYLLVVVDGSKANSSNYGLCPGLSVPNTKVLKYTLNNPNIPVFKLPASDFSFPVLSLWGMATIQVDTNQHPLRYFYNEANFQIPNQDTHQEGSFSNLFWFLLLLILGVGLVIVFRIIYRFVKRRRNRVEFQMTDTSHTNQNPMIEEASSSRSRPVNDNVGYGEFVDEVV